MNGASLLIDLRPALDGHAGIPIETRHLFANLRRLPSDIFLVTGLLQSAGNRLKASTLAREAPNEAADIAYQSAQLISAFFPDKPDGRRAIYTSALKRALYVRQIMRDARRDEALLPSPFDAARFENFLWTQLFAKTLPPEERASVVSGAFCTLEAPWSYMSVAGIRRRNAKPSNRRYPLINTSGYDYFLAQSPYPARVAANTKLLIRYHDSVPIFYPHTIENRRLHLDAHFLALKSNIESGAEFICVSEATRKTLLELFPTLADRAHVIHNQISSAFHDEPASAASVEHIVHNRFIVEDLKGDGVSAPAGETLNYVLAVSTLEPRKNHRTLIEAWESLKREGRDIKLVLVGGDGWESEDLSERLQPWRARGAILRLKNVPSEELCVLYQHAALTVCPSFEEGFDLSGVEAMASGGTVAASDIPVHREVFGSGAAYFDPYNPASLVSVLNDLLENATARAALSRKGRDNATRFHRDKIANDWREFFEQRRT